MSGNGPSASGFFYKADMVTGSSYALFPLVVVTDPTSSAVTVTVQLTSASDGVLSDPNAATDGGSYDSATGTYTVSGDAAQVTAALEGLTFTPSTSLSNGSLVALNVDIADGNGDSLQTGSLASVFQGTSYAAGGQNIDYSGTLTVRSSGGSQQITSVQGNYSGSTIATLSGADVALNYGVVWLAGGINKVEFDSAVAGGAWDAAYGDGGAFTLNNARLTVAGDDAQVNFLSGSVGNAVSFYGPATGGYAESVSGSGGTVIEDDVTVTLSGDNDLIYFQADDDILNLTAATASAWSTLRASSGTVNLTSASLSIIGGGVTVNAVSGDDAVSLYQTNGTAETINGAGAVALTLNQAQAVVNGGGGAVWFVGGSGSTVTLNGGAAPTTVYGAGTINLAGGEVSSIGGGALVDFQQAGGIADLAFTQGVYDRVQGAAGTINIVEAQAVVYGGNQTVNFVSGDDNAATLTQTNGDWDAVNGAGRAVTIDGAQANIYGEVRDVFLTGAGAQVSLYNQNGYSVSPNVWGSNATIILNGDNFLTIQGGGDTVFGNPAYYNYFTIAATNGSWDNVYMTNGYMQLNGAQASVFGGGGYFQLEGGASALSLYQTNGVADTVSGGGAVTLNDAQVKSPNGYMGVEYFYFTGAANSLDLSYYGYSTTSDDVLTFSGAFGVDTITGFGAGDKVQLSHAQFADFTAVQAALTQQGDDAVVTLDANDKVTFTGVSVSSLTASQFSFV